MLMHANAHEGCTDTVRESAPKVNSGRKIPCRTGESNLRRKRAGPMLYQLSYIPTPNQPTKENKKQAHAVQVLEDSKLFISCIKFMNSRWKIDATQSIFNTLKKEKEKERFVANFPNVHLQR